MPAETPDIRIAEACSPEDYNAAERLIRAYAASLGFDLCYQRFDREIVSLPEMYGPPRGRLLLADYNGEVVGCVALRPLDADACEMKRLYVRPGFRCLGLGRQLCLAVIDAARDLGYARMRLDTLSSMTGALALYRSLGFQPTPPYTHSPFNDAVFLELSLK